MTRKKAPCQKGKEDYNDILLFMVAGCFRLSDWDPAMEHDEPGQVGNQAALSRSFHVSDSIPADDFFFVIAGSSRITQKSGRQ